MASYFVVLSIARSGRFGDDSFSRSKNRRAELDFRANVDRASRAPSSEVFSGINKVMLTNIVTEGKQVFSFFFFFF